MSPWRSDTKKCAYLLSPLLYNFFSYINFRCKRSGRITINWIQWNKIWLLLFPNSLWHEVILSLTDYDYIANPYIALDLFWEFPHLVTTLNHDIFLQIGLIKKHKTFIHFDAFPVFHTFVWVSIIPLPHNFLCTLILLLCHFNQLFE